jgi:acetolactate synthase-1/2/3 large subunit
VKKTGAQIFIDCLVKEGVDTIFGYPGGAVLTIYDAIYHSPLNHILVRHEQGAVHAADGYARASGKPGVVVVTSGPGATNTVTGIATAAMDSSPLVVFSGQVNTPLIGNDAFQEADIVGITRPCTKNNYLVKDVKDLARIIREAFYLARTGRPGPVLIDIPKDIQAQSTDYVFPKQVVPRGYHPTYEGHPGQIKRCLEMLATAERPVLYIGGGVILSGAAPEIRKLAEAENIPVTMTLMGLGGFPGSHRLSLGMLGMHGTYWANLAVTECDFLIGIGARFDDRVTGKVNEFAPLAKKVHIDIDPTSISKSVKVHFPIVGDAKHVLQQLLADAPRPRAEVAQARQKWLKRIAEWKKDKPLSYRSGKMIKPQAVVEALCRATKGEAIITTEVGQNQMWTALFYEFNHPRQLITSGGLGTMGFGLPAAIGAQAAFPGKTVIDIAGDGSIQMNIQELATAVQHKLPVKVAILNNGFLGMVRQWQKLFYGGRYSHSRMDVSPDFVKLAEAYGATGLRAKRPEEVEPVIAKALKTKGPVIMDFVVEPEEDVSPMVPAGEAINKMILL